MTDAELMAAALIGLERQRAEIGEKMAELRQRLDGGAGQVARKSAEVDSGAPAVKKRTRSAAVRRRMAEAQRKRWAELKKAQAANAAPAKTKKRKLSAAGKRRIIAATKKRWATFHAKKAAAGAK